MTIERMSKTVHVAIVLFLAGNTLSQSGASAESHSFGEIFAFSLSAMGGESELRKIQSITALANCFGPRGKYITEIYSARGNRLLFKQISADGNIFLGHVHGEHVWEKDEKNGHVTPLDKTRAAMFRGHEFQLMSFVLPERFTSPRVEGRENFAGRACLRIRTLDELGDSCHVYFDTESHLLAGLILADPRSVAGETVRVVFNEWAQIGKVKLPSQVTATDKSGDWVLEFHDIKLNGVDEKIFDIPPSIAAVQELLHLQKQERAAHFGKDARLLTSVFADDFINIAAGKITRPARAESIKRLQAYFDRSEFLEWDDISPPIIRVAQDASMAYVIVHKRVRLRAQETQGQAEEATTIFAWIETYEKQNGKWVLTAVASTNEPPSQSSAKTP